MLKLYSDPAFLPPGSPHVPILYPFWGVQAREFQSPEVFDQYIREGQDVFQTCGDIQSCDYVILPGTWPAYQRKRSLEDAQRLADLAEKHGKPILVFTTGDEEWSPPFDATHFRPSIQKSNDHGAVYASPAWTRDILQDHRHGKMEPRAKSERPVVGFCGNAQWGLRQEITHLRRQLGRLKNRQNLQDSRPERWPVILRVRILRELAASPSVTANFILRDKNYANAKQNGQWHEQTKASVWSEYAQNMLTSDYVLCVRGFGNYSFRFYETLSAGRIPVFVNTDCALPYDSILDWRETCVWVEQNEIAHIGEKIAEFHNKLSPADFIDLQHKCRRVWDEWVSPHGFFRNLHRHFEQQPTAN